MSRPTPDTPRPAPAQGVPADPGMAWLAERFPGVELWRGTFSQRFYALIPGSGIGILDDLTPGGLANQLRRHRPPRPTS